MREIRFRAWDCQEKKMQYQDNHVSFHFSGRANWTCWWRFSAPDQKCVSGSGFQEDAIMQFTGLKDKNGKDLDWWEGDILKVWSTYETEEPIECLAVIKWDSKNAWFATDFHGMQVCGFTKDGNWAAEKVGNIHENPELLTKGKDVL